MASQAVTTREDTANNPIALFKSQLETRARDIQMALPGHITPDKFQRTILTAVAQSPDLLKADRQSLILSCYKAAQDGLLPDGREAALVVFNTRQKIDGQWQSVKQIQYMPMVYGLRKKILQSAEVVSLEVNVVYKAEIERGTFIYEVGLEPPLRHRPSLDLTEEETADEEIVAAYSIATMRDGTKSYEIMRRFEINKVRAVSQTGATGRTDRQGNPITPKGPWVDWFAEMAKKTVMRRHAKTLPMSGDVLIDIEGRELESGVSTAAALGSAVPDAPTAIEDHTDDAPPHDPETGEVHEEPEQEEPATGEQPAEASDQQREPTPAEEIGLDPPQPIADPGTTDADAVPTPAQEAVEKVIAAMDEAKTPAALAKIIADTEKHKAAMPDELAVKLEIAFSKNRARFEPVVEGAER